MSPRGRSRANEVRDINIRRQFIEEQLRVSVIAKQHHMNEPAVSAVIKRQVGPAFDGCPTTTVPVLWRLQRAYAELYGENQAIQLLEYFNLLNGRSAEAYVLQEAGISSGLYNTLIQGNKSRGVRLRKMVQIDPRAAWFAVQRLEEEGNWALEAQARRIRKYLEVEEHIEAKVKPVATPVVKTTVSKAKSKKRGSLAAVKKPRVEELTPKKSALKVPRRSARVPWGKISDVLIVIGLIALMAWLLVTIG